MFGRGELWGDGVGGAQALTTAFADGALTDLHETDGETEIVCVATIAVAACVAIEFRVCWTPTPTGTPAPLPSAVENPAFEVQSDRVTRINGAIGAHLVILRVAKRGFWKIQARAFGLGAGASLAMTGVARSPSDGRGVLGSGAGSAKGIISGPASIIDNGAGAPVALADAFAAIGAPGSSTWIDLDPATAELALILDTAVATPTYVELEVLWSRQLAATPPTGYFSEPDVASVDASAEYLVRRLTRWYGTAMAALPVSPPSRRHVVDRPPEALAYCVRARRGSAVAVTAQLWATQIG